MLYIQHFIYSICIYSIYIYQTLGSSGKLCPHIHHEYSGTNERIMIDKMINISQMRTPQVQIADLDTDCITCLRGVSRIFERGGPISLGSLKKESDFKRGGPMV